MISHPLPLFDEEIYGPSRENLKTDARDISIRPRNLPYVEAPYVFSPALAKTVVRNPEAVNNDNSFSAHNQSYLSDTSRFMNDEESDLYLLKMRMSNLQFSVNGSSSRIDIKETITSKTAFVEPILLEKDLQNILKTLQCQSSNSMQVQAEATAISSEIKRLLATQELQNSQVKMQRLLYYYISLQNALGLMDALSSDRAQQQPTSSYSKMTNSLISSDISFHLQNSLNKTEENVTAQEIVRNQLSTLDLVKPNAKQRLEALLQELALLPLTTAVEIDNRLKEAEEALIETIQRVQQQQLSGENVHDDKISLELQHRRQYLHKLLEIHELLTLPEEVLVSSKSSTSPSRRKSSPKKTTLRSLSAEKKGRRSMSPSTRNKERTVGTSDSLNRTHGESKNQTHSNSSPLQMQNFQVTPSKFGRTLYFGENSISMASPVSEKLSMDALRTSSSPGLSQAPSSTNPKPTPSTVHYPLTSRNASSPFNTYKYTKSANTPVDSLVASPASTSASASGSFPIRADSLSPSTFPRTPATVSSAKAALTSVSPAVPSSVPPSHTRAVSPLLFTSPAPPKRYQSPLLNTHHPATTVPSSYTTHTTTSSTSTPMPVSLSSPAEGRKRAISPSLLQPSSAVRRMPFTTPNTSSTSSGHPISDSVLTKSPVTSNNNPSVSPSVSHDVFLTQKNHVSFASSVHSPPTSHSHKHVGVTPAVSSSVSTTRLVSSPALAAPLVATSSPIKSTAATSTSITTPITTPITNTITSTPPRTLKTVRSFSAKDALVLQELLDSLKLSVHITRSELDQALHTKQQALQVALSAGERDSAQGIKAELEKLRAAYRLVALRG